MVADLLGDIDHLEGIELDVVVAHLDSIDQFGLRTLVTNRADVSSTCLVADGHPDSSLGLDLDMTFRRYLSVTRAVYMKAVDL